MRPVRWFAAAAALVATGCGFFAVAPRRPSPEPPFEAGEREAMDARGAWWFRQRGPIPLGAYRAATERWRALPRPARGVGIADTGAAWTPIGPTPLGPPSELPNVGDIAGRARAIAVTPDGKTLYVGFAQGGVWKSSDAGATWASITDALPAGAIGAIAVDPAAPATVYVGTGEPGNYVGQGLFVSTDGGATWSQPCDRFAGAAISKIFVDPGSGAIYLSTLASRAGAGDGCTDFVPTPPDLGLFRSDDGGATWAQIDPRSTRDFEVDTSVTPRAIYFAAPSGAYKLIEGGQAEPMAGLPDGTKNPVSIELALAADHLTLYAGVGVRGQNVSTLYVSHNQGVNWTAIQTAPNYCYGQCAWDDVVEVDPRDPNTVYLGGGLCAVYKTTDGANFSAVSLPGGNCGNNFANWFNGRVHPDVHAIAFNPVNPNVVYVASDGGLNRSQNGGATWQSLNDSFNTIQFYGICVDPKDPGVVYGGAQDNGPMQRGDGTAWQDLASGDGGNCVARTSLGDALVSVQFGYVVPAGDALGAPVFDAYQGYCQLGEPGCGDRVGFIAPLVGDPSNPANVYVGTHRLWRSQMGGAAGSWAPISEDLTGGAGSVACTGGGAGDDYLTAIAVAPGDGKTIYVGSAGGRVQRTRDGGASWQRLGAGVLPARFVSGIAVDPVDAGTVWVAVSGFDATTPKQPGHVFRSVDGGDHFARAGLPVDVPADAIAAHPVAPGLAYVGTDLGVLMTSDGGATWTPLDGLPAVAAYSLHFHPAGVLTVGTHGRGAWQKTFAATIAAAPASLTFTATAGAAPPMPQAVTAQTADPSGSIADLTVTAGAPWLAATPGSGRVAGRMTLPIAVTVDPKGLLPGEYDAQVTVADPHAVNGKVQVPVHLSIGAPPSTGGGCGCALGARARAPVWMVGLGLGLALLRRRRRVI